MTERYGSPAVRKAFEILQLMGTQRRPMGISDIAGTLTLGKSTVSAIMCAMEDMGAVKRDPATKQYTPGLTLFELGRCVDAQGSLAALARPVMEDLMEKVKESVFLGVLNVDHLTILEIVESRNYLRITSQTGTVAPLFAAATGKIFLADMDEDRAEQIIREKTLPRYTTNSITDSKKFLREIRRVRRLGYATDNEEYISGARAVAAPIHGLKDQPAAIWVVGFKEHLNDRKMKTLPREVLRSAEVINQRIKKQFVSRLVAAPTM